MNGEPREPDAPGELLACCKTGHDVTHAVLYGTECLVMCKTCDKVFYQVSVAIGFNPNGWEDDSFLS